MKILILTFIAAFSISSHASTVTVNDRACGLAKGIAISASSLSVPVEYRGFSYDTVGIAFRIKQAYGKRFHDELLLSQLLGQLTDPGQIAIYNLAIEKLTEVTVAELDGDFWAWVATDNLQVKNLVEVSKLFKTLSVLVCGETI